MNKVVTIHLDGIAYSLEEGAYDALRETGFDVGACNGDHDPARCDTGGFGIGAKRTGC